MNPEKRKQKNRRHEQMSGEPDPDTKRQSVQELANIFEAPGSSISSPQQSSTGGRDIPSHAGSTQVVEQPLQQVQGADSLGRVQEHRSQQSKGEGDRERLVIEPEAEKRSIQERKKRFEGRRSSFPPPQVSSRGRREMSPRTELFKMQRYKEDVTLDPDTAHPRLEIFNNGKSVKDTGTIKKVPSKGKRFDSHLYVLAKEGYTSGRHYWEVDVGQRSSWALGIARESVTRKGTLTLSPKNGLWVMGCTDGREYWAYTEPWTRLSVRGKLPKIGIFLDISSKQLLFYNVRKKAALYTFTIADGSSREGKLLPLFSTGSAAAKADTEPLNIAQGFDDDDE
ncbi:PREDICTED: E3 ubiquitin-protein ligase TRIM39-like [Calidris pugnax]|uniref:E3 ubiquitin-protein ligase TRIM39-like n=1 Tax=Calidris pugnax TaxID=198806 RepID=UPI00071D36DA|nr:PREDICTED: E3 ubiquitin-protein ligase TRIM39-like [Calidris pugnax]